MEKTIKNCLWGLFTIKSEKKNELQQVDKETAEEQIEFLNYAIDIIKKYQKIEQIIKKWQDDYESFDSMVQIRKVVDGSDN